MNNQIFKDMVEANINEINDTIDLLYLTSNSCSKNKLLNSLRKNISNIKTLLQDLQNGASINNSQPNTTKVFTLDELSKYNGKDGNPAYVAVNSIVYDVTNNAAWGGATHFGLTAGRDLTKAFSACHAGEPILSKLKVVGKMAE
ncbi:cytochrome b5 domain-containing protein [Oscillospiraceae bacterium LTW-04]|nr:cytochrome b5 domain-containing protein [Oscillospiraceae bacterium MB24-C1]